MYIAVPIKQSCACERGSQEVLSSKIEKINMCGNFMHQDLYLYINLFIFFIYLHYSFFYGFSMPFTSVKCVNYTN